jgi:single-stranded DNA-binding protein
MQELKGAIMKNSFFVQGRVTADGELRGTPSGKSVIVFTLAESVYVKGEKRDPNYWDCEIWENGAEYWGTLIKKGQILVIKGNLRRDSFKPQNSDFLVHKVVLKAEEIAAFDSYLSPKTPSKKAANTD